jgi:hypothetical protein
MRVLSLGGGQQSTAVYLLAANGDEGVAPLDYAIFADTGEEPKWVYETVEALRSYRTPEGKPGAPILVRWLTDSEGKQVRLGDNLVEGQAGRFASIPAFIKHLDQFDRHGNAQGKGRRQCTREFKTGVVELAIRRELLGLEKGQAYRGPRITQVFGLDRSEGRRIVRVKDRLAGGAISVGDFPLWDLEWKRADCVDYLASLVGWDQEVRQSACTFCPLVPNSFRARLRDLDPEGHRRACEIDAALRQADSIATKALDGELYVHRSMRPLAEVDLDRDDRGLLAPAMFGDCEGLCGL